MTFAVAGYTVAHGQIVEIDPLAAPRAFAVRPAPLRRSGGRLREAARYPRS